VSLTRKGVSTGRLDRESAAEATETLVFLGTLLQQG